MTKREVTRALRQALSNAATNAKNAVLYAEDLGPECHQIASRAMRATALCLHDLDKLVGYEKSPPPPTDGVPF